METTVPEKWGREMSFSEREVLGISPNGFHRLAYTQWGEGNTRDLICVHGLTRNGRDFDAIAKDLSDHYRVVCLDMPGRGRSDWLKTPLNYGPPIYMGDMVALIARLGGTEVDWIGTSMGALVGMLMAAQDKSPIRRLVLNDAGPFLPKSALERIAAYVGTDREFADQDDLEAYLREVHASFGPLTDAQWEHLATHSGRIDDAGRLRLHYDPSIAAPFTAAPPQDVDMWAIWDAIQCPVLLLRGAESDLLLKETAEEMTRRGPKATLVEFDGVGHAPALMDADQIQVVRDWLLA